MNIKKQKLPASFYSLKIAFSFHPLYTSNIKSCKQVKILMKIDLFLLAAAVEYIDCTFAEG